MDYPKSLCASFLVVGVSMFCTWTSVSAEEAVRVTEGLQVLYDFQSEGPVIKDRSGVGSPLDLRIENMGSVVRTPHSLEVISGTRVRSERSASRVSAAIKQSRELTIEAWVRPGSDQQQGPARIVTLSQHSTQRNVTLGQDGSRYDVRLRAKTTSENGLPSVSTSKNVARPSLSHVVYSRNRAGRATLFVNGQVVGQGEVKGALANWNDEFKLGLANELTGDRPWLGAYFLVALYSRALNAGEVRTNFAAGHLASSSDATKESLAENAGRVRSGLQVLYDFRETKGKLVKDRAGVGEPLDLRIRNMTHVRRTEGGLRLTGDTAIRSERSTRRLTEAIKRSGALSIEAWVRPNGLNQQGPARIVTLSKNANERNFTLGQQGDAVEVRLRTTKTSKNGIPAVASASGTMKEKITHVVYTRDRGGIARLFLDGVKIEETRVEGIVSNWSDQYQLSLADEVTGDRAWRGDLHLIAVYSRNLSPAEVAQNFAAGPKGRNAVRLAARQDQRALRFETEIAPLLSQHCLECHDSASRKGGLDLSRKKAAFAGGESGDAITPGQPHESLVWESVVDDYMPQDRTPLTDDEKQRLRKWIEDGAVWSVDYVDPAIYRNERTAENWVRRLTVTEYIETIASTFGVDIADEAARILPQDKRADGFRNTAYNLTVDLGHVEAFAELAEIVVAKMDVGAFARRFTKSKQLTDDNMRELIADMGKWVLRGPLEEHEVVVYRGISTTVASAGGDFNEAVGLVLEAMLQSPRLIYRIENQVGDGSRWPIGSYELATRISYILWGSSPDAALVDAAESGDLGDPELLRAQIARMLKDPRAVERSKQFVIEWLNLDRLGNMQPNKERFPNWGSDLADDMRSETIAYFEEVVWKQKRPLADLLNAQFTYLTPRLAKHYGLQPQGDKLERYDLADVPSRGGLLTHGSVLTIGGDDASMVTRGLFVLNDLLFSEVGDPPPGLDTTPVPTSPGRTHRAIATERIESTACGGCHSRFEPLAFGLEKFDGLGSFHDKDEHGNPLREDGEILFPGEAKPVSYSTSAKMMDLLASNDRVSQCLTRKVTQFALGRPLVASDAATVRGIHKASQAEGGTYESLVTAVIMSDLVRTTPTEAVGE